jgi:hypothetical protein
VSTDERMEDAAKLYDVAAEELEQAVAHCRTAAHHFRDKAVPRGAAHAWAALGHIRADEESHEAHARTHARASTPSP